MPDFIKNKLEMVKSMNEGFRVYIRCKIFKIFIYLIVKSGEETMCNELVERTNKILSGTQFESENLRNHYDIHKKL